jgi:alpha-tubulin suppressor-like RCC1 family protein
MKAKLLFVLCLIYFQANAQCWSKISAGGYHTAAIANDGSLWTWGFNNSGQLGDGTLVDKLSPIRIGILNNWIEVSAGEFHTTALRSDGTLWVWGLNSEGQLGDGTNTNRSTPIQIGSATTWTAVSAGVNHTLALRTNGTLWSWGTNFHGQLGLNSQIDQNTPTEIDGNNWSKISAGYRYSTAIRTDGTLWAWGLNNFNQLSDPLPGIRIAPNQIGTQTNWNTVTAGYFHTAAITNSGTLWTWGLNSTGQLGVGAAGNTAALQVGSDTNWSKISLGAYFSMATKSDGTLWTFGKNDYGQLGDGTLVNKTSPNQIGTLTNWTTTIDAGGYHATTIKSDGSSWNWGFNNVGQLADATVVNRSIPTAVTCPAALGAANFELNNRFTLYPNPVSNVLNISVENESIQNSVIYDVTGKQVKFQEGNTTSIMVDDLKSGFYFLALTIDGKREIKKFIKQ